MPRHERPKVPAYLEGWIKSFDLHLRVDHSTRTRQIYIDALRWLGGWTATQMPPEAPPVADWADINTVHLRLFFAHLAELGYAKGYRSNIARALQQFWTWWSAEEALPNPWADFSPPRAPKLGSKPPPVLATDQLSAILRD